MSAPSSCCAIKSHVAGLHYWYSLPFTGLSVDGNAHNIGHKDVMVMAMRMMIKMWARGDRYQQLCYLDSTFIATPVIVAAGQNWWLFSWRWCSLFHVRLSVRLADIVLLKWLSMFFFSSNKIKYHLYLLQSAKTYILLLTEAQNPYLIITDGEQREGDFPSVHLTRMRMWLSM